MSVSKKAVKMPKEKVAKHHKGLRNNLFIFALIFLIFYAYVFLTNSGTKCFVKSVTGIPCPSCGMTRSYIHVFHGEFRLAFIDHPLFVSIPFIIAAIIIMHYFRENKRLTKFLTGFLILMTVMFIGVYIYRMISYFPHTDPLKYYDGAIVPRIIRFVKGVFD